MIDPDSRYADLEVLEHTAPDGTVIRYVDRRFVPPSAAHRRLSRVAVVDGDRLDGITARTLGDPTQYWRICDANEAMHPTDLTDEPGSVLDVPSPI